MRTIPVMKYQMKLAIAKVLNWFLMPFGVKIVRNTHDQFLMSAGLERIVAHNIEVNHIIDIGASDGKWSTAALRVFSEARLQAIEPLAERETALKTLKQKQSRFDFELCVAGDTDVDQVILNVASDLDGSTVGGRGGKERYVKQKTIDRIVSDKNLKGPFLLKFDTHGYEVPILDGAKETLLHTNVIIMEVYNFHITQSSLLFHEMCVHMEDLGFRCFDIVDPMLRKYDKAFWQMDIFFCRKDCQLFAHKEYK